MLNKKRLFGRRPLTSLICGFLGMVLVAGLTAIFLVDRGFAGDLTSLPVTGISASYDKDTWAVKGTTIEGQAKATSGSACGQTTYTAVTTTLTITNTSGAAGTFSFDFTLALNSGSVRIDNTSKTADGTITKSNWANGSTVKIALTSPKSATAAKITLKNLSFELAEQQVTTKFAAGVHGSYTVANETGSFSKTISPGDTTVSNAQSSKNLYTITVEPDDGYELDTWQINGVDTSISSPYEQASNGATLKPLFKPSGSAVFTVDDVRYYSLSEADTAAQSASTKVIVLVENGSVSGGPYDISNDVTLLLPRFAGEKTVPMTTMPETKKDTTAVSLYLKLTISSGVTINVSGAICIPSSVCRQNGSSRTAAPIGPSSILHLEQGSLIKFKNGAKFYCWGFTTGLGTCEMESGSEAYELFQMPSYKGGGETTKILSECEENHVFPFKNYYIQNCEAHLQLDYGSSETIFFCTTIGGLFGDEVIEESVVFISKDDGMFHLTSSSGFIDKFYDSGTDRLIVNISGDVTVSSFTINVKVTVNTADYVLPITNNMTINILSGTTSIASGQDIGLMPSAELNIAEGATFQISSGASLYIHTFNADTWSTYTSYSATYVKMSSVMYTPTGGSTKRDEANNAYYLANRPYSSMKNAHIDVGGELSVSGAVYSTLATRNAPDSVDNAGLISTSGQGKVKFATNTLGDATDLKELKGTNSFDSIPVQAITMANGSNYSGNAVTHPVANKEFRFSLDKDHPSNYSYGCWDERALGKIDVTMKFGYSGNEGFVTLFTQTVVQDDEFTVPGYTYQSSSVKGWHDVYRSVFLEVGSKVVVTADLNNKEFYLFLGGWYGDKYYPREGDGDASINGLYRIPDSEETKTIGDNFEIRGGDICLFSSGSLVTSDPTVEAGGIPRDKWVFDYSSTSYPGKGDNQLYYLEKGVVQNIDGTISIGVDWYCFDSHHIGYRNGYYPVSGSSDFPDGIYYFDAKGVMVADSGGFGVPGKIEDGYAYYVITQNNFALADNYGLFALSGYLYYALPGGELAADNATAVYRTYYVSKTNGCTIGGNPVQEGLYYFDSQGRMYGADYSLITTGANES